MSKAFDSLHPPLLLSKLRAYGFQESAVQLLNSYLCDRVKLGSHVSSCRTVSRGCPLDPLLWNIFQNDLPYCVTTNLSMYAYDHQIYHTGRGQSSVTSKLRDSERTATKCWKPQEISNDEQWLQSGSRQCGARNLCEQRGNQSSRNSKALGCYNRFQTYIRHITLLITLAQFVRRQVKGSVFS